MGAKQEADRINIDAGDYVEAEMWEQRGTEWVSTLRRVILGHTWLCSGPAPGFVLRDHLSSVQGPYALYGVLCALSGI